MKKIISLALALIMVMGCLSSVSVCASAAGAPEESNSFKFALLTFIPGEDGKSAYIDATNVKSMYIYGVKVGSRLSDVVSFPSAVTSFSIDGSTDYNAVLRNGSLLTVTDENDDDYNFRFIIYGDIDCDGAVDVLDSAMAETVTSGSQTVQQVVAKIKNTTKKACVEKAIDINKDGEFTSDDFQQSVNISVDTESFDQTRKNAEEANTVIPDVDTQLFTGNSIEPVSSVEFNNLVLSIGNDYDINYSENIEKGVATVTITGKGLYTGTVVKNFRITDTVGKAAADLNGVLTDCGLGKVLTVTYDDVAKAFNVNVNSDALLAGNFSVDSTALTGMLSRIGNYVKTSLASITDVTVEGNCVYNGETVNNTALKNTLFSLANGFFVNVAGMDENGVIKTVQGSFTENEVKTDFTASFTASGTTENIATLKRIATKFANHMSFEVVGGNAVITAKMPQGFMNTLVDSIGDGDVAETKRQFDTLSVKSAFSIISDVTAEDFSSSTADFSKVIDAVASLDGFINKILTKITSAKITDTKGRTYTAMSDNDFIVDDTNANTFGAFAGAVGNKLSNEVRATKTGDYYLGNGIYQIAFDLVVDVSNLGLMSNGAISERVIIQLDIFDITDTNEEPAAKSGGSLLKEAKLPQYNTGNDDVIYEASSGSSVANSYLSSGSGYASLDGCPLAFVLDENGKIATLDYEKNIISGIKLGTADISEYLTLPTGSAYTLSVDYSFSNGSHNVISTGSVIKVMDGSNVVKSYAVSVPGDINGDGIIDVIDLFSIEREVNSSEYSILNDSQKAAVASVTGDEAVTVDDLQQSVNAALSEEKIVSPKKFPLTEAAVSAISDVIYNGYRQEPLVTVNVGGASLSKGSQFAVEFSNNLNVGTATVAVTGIGDYVGKVVKTFNIGKATITGDMISYASEIINYSGSKKAAAVGFDDITLSNALKIKYNGSETIPTATGIYIITVSVLGSANYYDASFTLGTLTVAPKNVSGEYTVSVDNDNRVITVNIIKPNAADTNILTALNSYVNSAYTLKLSGTELSSVTSSALSSRAFNVYTGQTGSNIVITSTASLLGGLLPDDETLWADYLASKSHTFTVAYGENSESFTVKFMQDKGNIELAKRKMLSTIATNGRGQRVTNTVSGDVLCYGKMGSNDYPTVRIAANNTSAKCFDALSGSGLKTMLVGYKDTLSIQASSTADFSGKEITPLYETSNSNYRYSKYSGTDVVNCIPVINKVMSGMGVSLPTNLLSLYLTKISTMMNKTGYCNYRCAESTCGLRYNNVYYLEIKDFVTAEDSFRTISVNTPVNGTLTTDVAAAQLVAAACGEQITLTVKPSSGYSVETVTVKDASGNAVQVTAENGYYYFYMPASNVTVDATFAQA